MNPTELLPTNPYRSFLVKASAGSGKTYQLSRRFLFLVAAGTDPTLILTVTFTKKAAAEMRDRILKFCHEILRSSQKAAEFDEEIRAFHQFTDLPPPLSALKTAQTILAAQLNLNISTMDALFNKWVRTFSLESSHAGEFPAEVDVMAEHELQTFQDKAWNQALSVVANNELVISVLANAFEEKGLPDVQKRILALAKNYETHLWLSALNGQTTLQVFPDPDASTLDARMAETKSYLEKMCEFLGDAGQIKVRGALTAVPVDCAPHQFVDICQRAGVLTQDKGELSGRVFSKKQAERFPDEFAEANDFFVYARNYGKIVLLNALSKFFVKVYDEYQMRFQELKFSEKKVEFNDFSKGAYFLFANPDALGARYLIQRGIHHILLDEFQDTNPLQWAIFKELAKELLSGANHDLNDRVGPPTLFLVGDVKQSIYGFRGAEPELMQQARKDFSEYLHEVELSESFRTSQILLDVVNASFGSIADFPKHSAARDANGMSFVPNHGQFVLGPLFDKSGTEGPSAKKPVEKEAEFVAQYCKELIESKTQIWDAKKQVFRTPELSDICLLYRNATHCEKYERAFTALGLATVKAEKKGYFSQSEVEDLQNLYRYFCLPADISALCSVLRSPIVGLNNDQLAECLKETSSIPSAERNEAILKYCDRWEPRLCRLLLQSGVQRLPRDGTATAAFLGFVATQNVKEKMVNYWPAIANQVSSHFDRFCELVTKLKDPSDIQKLFTLDQMAAEDAAGALNENKNAVRFMTIHKAKGLEFPVVILVDCARTWEKENPYWTKDDGQAIYYIGNKGERPRGFLPLDNALAADLALSTAENARLLYVALTRARNHILVTGYCDNKENFMANPQGFYDDVRRALTITGGTEQIFAMHPCLISEKDGTRDRKSKPLELVVSQPIRKAKFSEPILPINVKNVTPHSQQKEKQRHSVSLQDKDPIYAQAVGLWVHQGLEKYIKKEKWEQKLAWELITSRLRWPSNISAEQAYADAQKQLQQCLRSESWQTLTKDCKKVFAELPLAYLDGSQFVHGIIDLLVERPDGTLLVVDYKSAVLDEKLLDGQDWVEIAEDRGYTNQIRAYTRGVELLYPGRRVEGGVFFTASLLYRNVL